MKKLILFMIMILLASTSYALFDSDGNGYIDIGVGGTNAGTEADTGFMLESNIGTGANNYIQLDGNGDLPMAITIQEQKDFTITSPADTDDFLLFKAQAAITITDIHCIVDPADTGDSISINIQECNSTGDSCAVVDAAITCSNTGAADDGTLSNGNIDAGDWVKVLIGAPSGTVDALTFSIYYTEAKQ